MQVQTMVTVCGLESVSAGRDTQERTVPGASLRPTAVSWYSALKNQVLIKIVC